MFDTLIGHTYTRKCNSWVYITKINSIFCVKTCVINQINATANDISCCESWTIRFSCSGWAEGVPIISMVTIWILFPTYQPGTKNQVNFLHFQKHYGTTSWLRKKKKSTMMKKYSLSIEVFITYLVIYSCWLLVQIIQYPYSCKQKIKSTPIIKCSLLCTHLFCIRF